MNPKYIFVFLLSGWIGDTQGKSLVASPDAFVDSSSTFESNFDKPTTTETTTCKVQPLGLDDVEFLDKGHMYLKNYNVTIDSTTAELNHDNQHICFNRSDELKAKILKDCQKWAYQLDEFTVSDNGTVVLYEEVLEPGTFMFKNGNLLTCAVEDPNDNTSVIYRRHKTDLETIFIYVGQIGSSISIVALMAHLVTFCLVPSLRNLPGYNLASLSVAFLFAYSFVLIGQIPEVLGLFCIISGVLQQNFFLIAFFCMNVMAIDIWRTLRLATQKLVVNSDDIKKRQFIFYTIYSWGAPLLITITSVLMDTVKNVPEWIQPQFGRYDTCWMNNNTAKAVFFSIPAFTLFVVNGIFFVMSAFIIKNNTMKSTNDDQQKQTVRLNFVLYIRLALMMGVTWLLGVLAAAVSSKALWHISDTLNSLQGLFVFLLFTCSRKVFNRIKEKVNNKTSSKVNSADKQTTSTSKNDTTESSSK